MISFWSRAERHPPVLVRLLARRPHGAPLTSDEISKVSGLPAHQVDYISHLTDWAGVDLPTMRKFLVGCGVDFENFKQMDRVDAYLHSKPSWRYLRLSEQWGTFYQPLMRRFRQAVG